MTETLKRCDTGFWVPRSVRVAKRQRLAQQAEMIAAFENQRARRLEKEERAARIEQHRYENRGWVERVCDWLLDHSPPIVGDFLALTFVVGLPVGIFIVIVQILREVFG